MYADVFPSRLKSLRERYQTTQKEAAESIGIGRVTLYQYEKGEREPNLETLARIAIYYGTTTDWLCGLSKDSASNESDEEVLVNSIMKRSEKLKRRKF